MKCRRCKKEITENQKKHPDINRLKLCPKCLILHYQSRAVIDGLCSECGKPIKSFPHLYHRTNGKRVCPKCLNASFHSEAWLESGTDPESATALTFIAENGDIRIRCGIGTAIEKLCELEEKCRPWERYTFRREDTGKAAPRREIKLILARLYDYEHGQEEEQ